MSSCDRRVWERPFLRAMPALEMQKHPLETECEMNKASDFSTPRREVLSTSLLQTIKENNCVLTTRIDILK